MGEDVKKSNFSWKDYITIASIIFLAGGGWAKIQSIDERVQKVEKINPELIDYKLNKIEQGMIELKEMIKDLPDE